MNKATIGFILLGPIFASSAFAQWSVPESDFDKNCTPGKSAILKKETTTLTDLEAMANKIDSCSDQAKTFSEFADSYEAHVEMLKPSPEAIKEKWTAYREELKELMSIKAQLDGMEQKVAGMNEDFEIVLSRLSPEDKAEYEDAQEKLEELFSVGAGLFGALIPEETKGQINSSFEKGVQGLTESLQKAGESLENAGQKFKKTLTEPSKATDTFNAVVSLNDIELKIVNDPYHGGACVYTHGVDGEGIYEIGNEEAANIYNGAKAVLLSRDSRGWAEYVADSTSKFELAGNDSPCVKGLSF